MRNARREYNKARKDANWIQYKVLNKIGGPNPNNYQKVIERKALALMKAQEYVSGLKKAGTPKKTVLLGIKQQYGFTLTEARKIYKQVR